VLRETVGGGFVAPTAQLFALPVIVIYGDGVVLMPTTSTEVTTGAVPPVTRMRLSEAGIQAMLGAAQDAGLLGKNAQYEGGPVADAATTTFTLTANGRTHTVSAYALGHEDGPGLDPAIAQARAKLLAFDQTLAAISMLAGTNEAPDPLQPYAPMALQVFVSPGQDAGPGAPSPISVAWPLTTSLDAFGDPVGAGSGGGGVRPSDLRCGVVTGADLATLTPLFAKADQSTMWTSAGKPYQLTVRPQLPDETTCPGL
jgi:hypothetical protein